ncbi:MAG: hypothetical protein AAF289_17400 [Cyanobacteria bacterium P01_A01_bin.135]
MATLVNTPITAELRWDLAGRDALPLVRSLFGNDVERLAPFQSLNTTLEGEPCALLRLCDRNFRVACGVPLDQHIQPGSGVWARQLPWLRAIVLPDAVFPALAARATVRPPHRLDLPCNAAVPAHLAGVPLLLWRRGSDPPQLDLHLAEPNVAHLQPLLDSLMMGDR